MTTTLILGGGFGGLACARALRARAPREHRILLIDRSPVFTVGAAKTWVMTGERRAEEVVRSRADLVPEGVEWLREEVTGIDVPARRVKTYEATHTADHLVIALGVEHHMAAVPGLDEAAHTFYTLDGARRTQEALSGFRAGRLVILVPRTPFACPPAPYEAAFMIHELLEQRGLRAGTKLEVWTMEKAPMATAGPEMGRRMIGELESRGIGFHGLKKALSVDAKARRVRFEDGSDTEFDLLLAVPPHRVPGELVDAKIAEPAGWVRVDPKTLELRVPGISAPGVYAIGDATGLPLPGRFDPSAPPLALPKAGVMAAAQGEIVAARIAAQLEGSGAGPEFDGRGFCFVETGRGRAFRAEADFFAEPHPVMTAQPSSEALYREKVDWIEGWLRPMR